MTTIYNLAHTNQSDYIEYKINAMNLPRAIPIFMKKRRSVRMLNFPSLSRTCNAELPRLKERTSRNLSEQWSCLGNSWVSVIVLIKLNLGRSIEGTPEFLQLYGVIFSDSAMPHSVHLCSRPILLPKYFLDLPTPLTFTMSLVQILTYFFLNHDNRYFRPFSCFSDPSSTQIYLKHKSVHISAVCPQRSQDSVPLCCALTVRGCPLPSLTHHHCVIPPSTCRGVWQVLQTGLWPC